MAKTLRTSGDYTIDSGTGVTTIKSIIKLNPKTRAQLYAQVQALQMA